MAAMVAPGLGPTLGGWLATSVSWHWLFLVDVPIGAVAAVVAARLVPDQGDRQRRTFDGLGLVLGCGGLAVAVLGTSQANDWGWGSVATIGCLVGGVGALAGFVHPELHTDDPMIELRMFSDRAFRLAITTMLLVVVAQFGRLVYIPLVLDSCGATRPWRSGRSLVRPWAWSARPSCTRGAAWSTGSARATRSSPASAACPRQSPVAGHRGALADQPGGRRGSAVAVLGAVGGLPDGRRPDAGGRPRRHTTAPSWSPRQAWAWLPRKWPGGSPRSVRRTSPSAEVLVLAAE